MKLFTKDINAKLFKQFPMGSNLEKQFVVAKVFNPYGEGRWFLLNSDPEDPDYIWAIVQMHGEVEMGSVSRRELETLKVGRWKLPLERDLGFSPVNAAQLMSGLREGKFYKNGGWVEYANGGVVKWQDAQIGDNARVIAENKTGLIMQAYGRKFHLKFVDGTEKTYDAKELEFFTDEEFAKGGSVKKDFKVGDKVIYSRGGKWFVRNKENFHEGVISKIETISGSKLYTIERKNSNGVVIETFQSSDTKEIDLNPNEEFEKGGVIKKNIINQILSVFKKNTRYGSETYPTYAFVVDTPSASSVSFRTKYFGDWKDNIVVSYEGEDFFRISQGDKTIKTLNLDLLSNMLKELHKEKVEKYKNYLTNEGSTDISINNSLSDVKFAKGGMVVTSIKDIPNFKERLEEGKITYRGLGMGKLSNDFYKIAGTSGTRIKVDGKEYYITDEEFDTFSRGADGKMRIKFDAPARRGYAEGGEIGYEKYDTKSSAMNAYMKGELSVKDLKKVAENNFQSEIAEEKQLDEFIRNSFLQSVMADEYGISKEELVKKVKELKSALFGNNKMAKGGVTFSDKVSSIKSSLLKRKKVSPKVQKDYGKTYSSKEAEESAKRIVGAMTAKERLKKSLKKVK